MKPEGLPELVAFDRPVETVDDYGGVATSFVEGYRCNAHFLYLRGGETVQAAREATVWTLFHYGITGWGMYALMGMALGFFAYRLKSRHRE